MRTQEAASIGFVGASNSGKTTLIERLLPLLAAKGVRVVVVKHTHHLVDWDRAGKDSWRFREAGAARVVLSTPELTLAESRSQLSANTALLADADLVIHEGDRQSETPKVIVGETVAQAREKGTRGRILARVDTAEDPASADVARFDRDDIDGVARFLLGLLHGAPPPAAADFEALLAEAVRQHGHLCPGQVLGVRMAIRGLADLGLGAPPPPKRVIAVVETDRCAADAVGSVSGCSLGRRTLKHFDFGKMAASFLDTATGAAVRVVARDDSRERVPAYVSGIEDPHHAQLAAYQLMPDEELLTVQPIRMELTEADMPGRPRGRIACGRCGEGVTDSRQVLVDGEAVCRACAGGAYYSPAGGIRSVGSG
ncbi:MAG TPA: molybdopterin-guanine dinucleotide biosynthesis protein B [Dehalococcoidia bacterium]